MKSSLFYFFTQEVQDGVPEALILLIPAYWKNELDVLFTKSKVTDPDQHNCCINNENFKTNFVQHKVIFLEFCLVTD